MQLVLNVVLAIVRRRLSANRWACDCRLGWLARWLRTRRQAVETDAAGVQCATPAVLGGSQLADLADLDFQCSRAPPHPSPLPSTRYSYLALATLIITHCKLLTTLLSTHDNHY